jgi:hypothetical protein
VRSDGISSFSMMQAASDAGNAAGLAFFIFFCTSTAMTSARGPLIERRHHV